MSNVWAKIMLQISTVLLDQNLLIAQRKAETDLFSYFDTDRAVTGDVQVKLGGIMLHTFVDVDTTALVLGRFRPFIVIGEANFKGHSRLPAMMSVDISRINSTLKCESFIAD